MNKKKRIVIVGATSAIAQHCARLWVQTLPSDLILIGRDASRIERVAKDLKVRSPESEIQIVEAASWDAQAIEDNVKRLFKSDKVDIVLIAQGYLPDQAECQEDLKKCEETLQANGVMPALYAEAFALHMEKENDGTIILIGSVAGDRGRKSNYAYGAAKGLLARYAQGMQHRFSGTGVNIVLVKPGPTDTPMTALIKGKGMRLATVESVAKRIVESAAQKKLLVYAPFKWRIIMSVVVHLPSFIFNKTNL